MPIYALIPALPLAAFLILALGGRRIAASSHRIGTPAVALSFGLSVAALFDTTDGSPIAVPLYRLLEVGDLVVDVSLYRDPLAALLLPLVTGVSFVVHVYSSNYMTGDPRYRRFFAVMALFTAAMAMLVLSGNLLVMYMCWEVMGICSYLLISHWADRPAAGKAATKAFLVNAVADIGLGFGVILAFATYGTLDIQELLARASGGDLHTLSWLGFEIQTNTVIALCLLSGAMGKSAQFPLHVWLPYAMEAPTPVSALIHAATMVNAGPFLLVRFSPLLLLAPKAMVAIAAVGAVTALYGALVSLTQSDIKKLLAYSTISQIGFMIFACGVGAFAAAIFHLLAHGFLKGFLFLSTGTALETAAVHAPRREPLPADRLRPLALGAFVLGCVPAFLLFAGPYERIWNAQGIPAARAAFWAIGLATVFLTALYAFRGIVSLFGGAVGRPVSARPRLLSFAHVPGIAAAGIVVSALTLGLWAWFGAYLAPALGASPPVGPLVSFSPTLAVPLAAAFAGWALAFWQHVRPTAQPLANREWAKTAYVLFLNKLYIDELHQAGVVQPTLRVSRWLWRGIDLRCIDRGLSGTADATKALAGWLRGTIETSGIDRGVGATAPLLMRFSRRLWRVLDIRSASGPGDAPRKVEPRPLQHQLVIVICWLVLAIGLSYWLAL